MSQRSTPGGTSARAKKTTPMDVGSPENTESLKIAVVTSDGWPVQTWAVNADNETLVVQKRLKELRHDAQIVAWDGDDDVDWTQFDRIVMVAGWSMWKKVHLFIPWVIERDREAKECGNFLLNPREILLAGWNKGYLSQLIAAGENVVDTVTVSIDSIPSGEVFASLYADSLDGVTDDDPWVWRDENGRPLPSFLVKPLTGGGDLEIKRFTSEQLNEARTHIKRIHDGYEDENGEWVVGQPAILQPYIHDIDHNGELNVVMVNGKVAYAVTKDPIHRDAGDEGGVTLVAHPHPRMVELSDAEVAHIQRVYETYMEKCAHLPLDRPPLHLRLDFIRKKATPEIPDGDPRLLRALEVEMQPSKHWKLYMEYLDYVAEGRRPPLRNVDPNAFANFIQAIIDPPELRHSREQTAEVVEGVDVVSPDDTRELD